MQPIQIQMWNITEQMGWQLDKLRQNWEFGREVVSATVLTDGELFTVVQDDQNEKYYYAIFYFPVGDTYHVSVDYEGEDFSEIVKAFTMRIVK